VFGGGTDLTPYYLFEEDAVYFHKTYKNTCDKFDASFYPNFKETCDNYFVNWHRNNERRGIGAFFMITNDPIQNRIFKSGWILQKRVVMDL
jgi:coproporphyrinogen III oxidase